MNYDEFCKRLDKLAELEALERARAADEAMKAATEALQDAAIYGTGSYKISIPKGYSIASLPIDNMKLDPSGKWNPWISEPTETPSTEVACDHKWVDVGFCFSKIVCSECNAEKPAGD